MPLAPRLLRTSGAVAQKLSRWRIGSELEANSTCAARVDARERAAKGTACVHASRAGENATDLILRSGAQHGADPASHPRLAQLGARLVAMQRGLGLTRRLAHGQQWVGRKLAVTETKLQRADDSRNITLHSMRHAVRRVAPLAVLIEHDVSD